jgi:hypothetical protein
LLVTITVALAAVAVLGAIVVVAMGGGGELSTEHPDHPPLALPGRRAVGGTDAALLRLPLGLWGYHKQITDEALERFAHELTERDTRIAVLEQQLAEARQGRSVATREQPRALPPGPVTAEDTYPTRAALPVGDPHVTRTDRDQPETGFAPPDDPWKTIVDRRTDDDAEAGPDRPQDERTAARKDDGE